MIHLITEFTCRLRAHATAKWAVQYEVTQYRISDSHLHNEWETARFFHADPRVGLMKTSHSLLTDLFCQDEEQRREDTRGRSCPDWRGPWATSQCQQQPGHDRHRPRGSHLGPQPAAGSEENSRHPETDIQHAQRPHHRVGHWRRGSHRLRGALLSVQREGPAQQSPHLPWRRHWGQPSAEEDQDRATRHSWGTLREPGPCSPGMK